MSPVASAAARARREAAAALESLREARRVSAGVTLGAGSGAASAAAAPPGEGAWLHGARPEDTAAGALALGAVSRADEVLLALESRERRLVSSRRALEGATRAEEEAEAARRALQQRRELARAAGMTSLLRGLEAEAAAPGVGAGAVLEEAVGRAGAEGLSGGAAGGGLRAAAAIRRASEAAAAAATAAEPAPADGATMSPGRSVAGGSARGSPGRSAAAGSGQDHIRRNRQLAGWTLGRGVVTADESRRIALLVGNEEEDEDEDEDDGSGKDEDEDEENDGGRGGKDEEDKEAEPGRRGGGPRSGGDDDDGWAAAASSRFRVARSSSGLGPASVSAREGRSPVPSSSASAASPPGGATSRRRRWEARRRREVASLRVTEAERAEAEAAMARPWFSPREGDDADRWSRADGAIRDMVRRGVASDAAAGRRGGGASLRLVDPVFLTELDLARLPGGAGAGGGAASPGSRAGDPSTARGGGGGGGAASLERALRGSRRVLDRIDSALSLLAGGAPGRREWGQPPGTARSAASAGTLAPGIGALGRSARHGGGAGAGPGLALRLPTGHVVAQPGGGPDGASASTAARRLTRRDIAVVTARAREEYDRATRPDAAEPPDLVLGSAELSARVQSLVDEARRDPALAGMELDDVAEDDGGGDGAGGGRGLGRWGLGSPLRAAGGVAGRGAGRGRRQDGAAAAAAGEPVADFAALARPASGFTAAADESATAPQAWGGDARWNDDDDAAGAAAADDGRGGEPRLGHGGGTTGAGDESPLPPVDAEMEEACARARAALDEDAEWDDDGAATPPPGDREAESVGEGESPCGPDSTHEPVQGPFEGTAEVAAARAAGRDGLPSPGSAAASAHDSDDEVDEEHEAFMLQLRARAAALGVTLV